MDRLFEKSPIVDQILAYGGERFISLRGHGGTGKTVTLLQAATQAYRLGGERTLVLTYNHALAADIRRLLALRGVPTGDEGGISVQTAMSFFYSWLHHLGVSREPDDSFSDYEAKCVEALATIDGGALGGADIDAIKISAPDRFDFDRVVVDEAQDWPSHEIALLRRLYRPETIAVGDGIDQLVRGEKADWLQGTTRDTRANINLVRCLRMKRNLAVFASALADEAGIDLDILPNDKAGGGRVVLVRGDWSEMHSLHDELSAAAKEAKNQPVDSLFCVPNSSIAATDSERSSTVAKALRNWGYSAWDGVDEERKKDFPRSTDEYRIVHYKSCRGLEGWTVVLEHLDRFWTDQFQEKIGAGLTPTEHSNLQDLDELATRQAWRWSFIALTRPIDTLVITLEKLDSPLSKALLKISMDLPDVIENRI